MRICKISEVLGRVGEQISGVSGTLKAVWKAKTGAGQYGPWSLQDAVLVDDSGEMTITFANFDDMSRLKGQKVTITAKQGDKGLSGLIVKESEYNNKKYIKLHVTGSAMIDSGVTHESNEAPTDAPIPLTSTDPEEQAALDLLAKKKAEKEAAAKLEREAKIRAAGDAAMRSMDGKRASGNGRMNQIANLYSECVRLSKWALDKELVEMADLPGSVATLFIAMRDDNLTDSMPTTLMGERLPGNAEQIKTVFVGNESIVQADPEPAIDQEPKEWFDIMVATKNHPTGIALGEMQDEEIMDFYNTFRPKNDPKTGTLSMRDIHIKNALVAWKKDKEEAL